MARFRVKQADKFGPDDTYFCGDIITIEEGDRMEVSRSGALGFITKAGRLVRAIAPGAWDDAWEVTETEKAQG